jgi:hypothetical protein
LSTEGDDTEERARVQRFAVAEEKMVAWLTYRRFELSGGVVVVVDGAGRESMRERYETPVVDELSLERRASAYIVGSN